jgi:hypothetical protein
MFVKPLLALCALLVVGGCQSRIDLAQVSHDSALTPQTVASAPYPLQGLLPVTGHYPHLRVYIEGDGHAWATRSQPSTDPTPVSSVMIALAVRDSQPSVYLARPCQFVLTAGCGIDVWTGGRFNASVLTSMSGALDELKRRYAVEHFELVGYSGGAAIALVLAGTRNDVTQVSTLAGNLDPEFWTRLQSLAPLQHPVLPLTYRAALRTIPQRHFVGLEDKVVPPAVADAYVAALKGRCVEVIKVHADHAGGFEESWARYANVPIRCD